MSISNLEPGKYKNMSYEYVDNGSSVLIILFQSAGRITNDVFPMILDGSLAPEDVRRMHDFLNWRKMPSAYPGADYLFVKDYYSRSYGWYTMDEGRSIHHSINLDLDQFISEKPYERVIAFGSSKGGTAALLYGMLNRHITHVLSLVPQIEIGRYWRKYFKDYMQLILGSNNPETKELYLNELMYSDEIKIHTQDTIFYTYTGIKDDQFAQIVKFHNSWIGDSKHSLIVNTSNQRHTPLVTENLDFIYDCLQSFVEYRPIVNKSLIRTGNESYLLV